MKTRKLRDLAIYLLSAALLLWACASGPEYQPDNGGCPGGQYRSQSAGCVPYPGP